MKNTVFAILCLALVASCMILPACGKPDEQTAAEAPKIVVGFSQIGSESDWRAANTLSIKGEAKKRGLDLRFADAQQKQENQIKALRNFIDQKVDIIAFSPKVETGWQTVLEEIKKAGIPVILTDRGVDVTDSSLYVTFIGSDFTEEGRRAAKWFIENTEGDLKVFELRGSPGASCAVDRKKGFEETIAAHPRIKIIKSQDGDFERGKGKEVMEAFLKTPEGKTFNALYAHNDDMALGAIQAIKEAGRKPGEDIKIVSVDAVKAAFEAMVDGELNCTVECNPLLGPKLFDIVEAVMTAKRLAALGTKHKLLKPAIIEALGGDAFEKRIAVDEGVYDQSVAKEQLPKRTY
jgi:ABC-type sugar transport system substrate-binding protein